MQSSVQWNLLYFSFYFLVISEYQIYSFGKTGQIFMKIFASNSWYKIKLTFFLKKIDFGKFVSNKFNYNLIPKNEI